jgi:hypothetical protein
MNIDLLFLRFVLFLCLSAQSTAIRVELERLHMDNIELNQQRQTTQIKHEIQMKKLHDQYAKQLHDAEQWPDRLQTELTRERESHRLQIIDVETRLKQNFLLVSERILLIVYSCV